MRLRTKVLLAFLPLAAAGVFVVALTSRPRIEKIVIDEAVRRVNPQGVDLAHRLAPLMAKPSEQEILPVLQEEKEQAGAVYIAALDPAGRVIAHTNIREAGSRVPPESLHPLARAPAWERVTSPKGELLILSIPVWEPSSEFLLSSPSGNRRLGEIHIALSLTRSIEGAGRIAEFVAAAVAVFCLVVLALTWSLMQWLVAPVRQLSEAMSRIMAGDYGSKVPVLSKDEVGDLADAFNRMSDTLSRTTVSRDELAKALAVAEGTVEASSEGIVAFDLEGKTLSFNKRFLEMWELSPEKARLGRQAMMDRVREMVEDPDEFIRRADDALRDLDRERVDEVRMKNGRIYKRTMRSMYIGGRVFARVLSFQDLTAARETEQALAQARDTALQTARMKSEFLANMSHELRTPLNALIGSAELLRGGQLQAEQRQLVDGLEAAASTLRAMVNGVLDFSKIEAGRMSVERIPFRLRRVLHDALSITQARASDKGLDVVCESGSACEEVLLGDPTRLRQVLINLLDNAVKFTSEGTIRLRCRVEPGEGRYVTLAISIEDTGIGIDAAVLPSVFEPFTQADSSTSRRYGGTGLGLSISKSLVELLGGTIGADSEPGKGSRFWVRIPFERTTLPPESPASRVPLAGEPARRDRQRVLIVEDNDINRRLLQMQVGRLGRPSDAVDNGEAALEAMARAEYGFVLMDCQMPGVDGYEAARRVREAESGRRRVPIVALTAHAGEADRSRCLEAGMDDYLSKPTTLEELAPVLDRWDLPYDATAVRAYAAVAAPDAASLRSLMADFIGDCAGRLERAKKAVGAGDRAAAAAEVHAVKGAAASLGARGLRELCRRIELALEAGPDAELGPLTAQAEAELERLRLAGGSLDV